MVDFIEYVVSDLKSKRLSKDDALSLINQFMLKPSNTGPAGVIHPLVHRNTSDLTEQRYSTRFNGEEFFLRDHKIHDQGVLPGVAYLEMARAAFQQAMPGLPETAALEIQDVIWSKPGIVGYMDELSIVLFETDNHNMTQKRICFEIFSYVNGSEQVHCNGLINYDAQITSTVQNLETLKQQMLKGSLPSADIYVTYAEMGIHFGPAHQGIKEILLGEGQLLADLHLPSCVEKTADAFLLHPSLLDSALQAIIGLNGGLTDLPHQVPMPFSLASLTIHAPFHTQMYAWIRYSSGFAGDRNTIKADIDLYSPDGRLCAQLEGFSARYLTRDISLSLQQTVPLSSLLLAEPVWKKADAIAEEETSGNSLHYLVLCNMTHLNKTMLEKKLSGIHCVFLDTRHKNIAESYRNVALSCFELIKNLIAGNPRETIFMQLIADDSPEQSLLGGLIGLIKTASQENNNFTGQIILTEKQVTIDELALQIRENYSIRDSLLINYKKKKRYIQSWQECAQPVSPSAIVFKDSGIYLITGGLGKLGILLAKEILTQTSHSKIILTGRSDLNDEKQKRFDLLNGSTNRVFYRSMDLGDKLQVAESIKLILQEFGTLDGIIHCAGMKADNFIAKKSSEEFSRVLTPKVEGVFHLDSATREIDLDFFVLFSSVASTFGNIGQADYAAANGFLDQFARYRNYLGSSHQRKGKTHSINWPLWADGGMHIDPIYLKALAQTVGMQAMRATTGLDAFYRSFMQQQEQTLVMEGDLEQIRGLLSGHPAPLMRSDSSESNVASLSTFKPSKNPEESAAGYKSADNISTESLMDLTKEFLRKKVAIILKIPVNKIDIRASLDNYGIDSILAMELTSDLEKDFGALSKTLFFEYQTLTELSAYFLENYSDKLAMLLASHNNVERADVKTVESSPPKPEQGRGERSKSKNFTDRSVRRRALLATHNTPSIASETIAIVGLSGRYPGAKDLDEYWDNLKAGRDCITEVPKDRWEWRDYYTEDRTQTGYHFSRWGGFIEGVDEFDPLFFNISPIDAEKIDPQERLFLQHSWMAIEDAGYTRETLQIADDDDLAGQVGVYVGVMYGEYQLYGVQASLQGRRMGFASNLASIANRVSYFLNLHGPSMMVDTMCSSSLTAIHIACQDLKAGRTSLAIAGGVNTSIHPNKYLILSDGQFISSDGHCQSFGEGGEGYIPGEGVGVVLLKRLSEAEQQGDHIYGVIRGSALNHGGKTNGFTVPSPKAQASAINRALKEAHIDPRHISYVEAHGTGTKLGDPIEIAGLTHAFNRQHNSPEKILLHESERAYCLIGSAKSNIGHCESAAGIAGLTKVLLQMRHRQIAPSLHSEKLNPNINFNATPFLVNQELKSWEQFILNDRQIPRIAGISSFGAGGSNAHLIVEEYTGSKEYRKLQSPSLLIVPLSARTPEQLKEVAERLLSYLQSKTDPSDSFVNVVYTLQAGREAMEERLAFIVNSVTQLCENLETYIIQGEIKDGYRGQIKRNQEGMLVLNQDDDINAAIDRWVARKKYHKLMDLWVKGLTFDWNKLYQGMPPKRVSLPTYPFAKERYWIDEFLQPSPKVNGESTGVLHPLIHKNTSTIFEQSYQSSFSGDEFYLAGHQVELNTGRQEKVLPAVAYLEMARAALKFAVPTESEPSVIELCNVVWMQPMIFSKDVPVSIELSSQDEESIRFEVTTQTADNRILHCQGQAAYLPHIQQKRLDLLELKQQMAEAQIDLSYLYSIYNEMGIHYGSEMRSVRSILRGQDQVLVHLQLPETLIANPDLYILHPSIIDSALHAVLALNENWKQTSNQLMLPFSVDSVKIVANTSIHYAWIRFSADHHSHENMSRVDIDFCDENGRIGIQFKNLISRELAKTPRDTNFEESLTGAVLSVPRWQYSQARSNTKNSVHIAGRPNVVYEQHRLILCELFDHQVDPLSQVFPETRVYRASDNKAHFAQRYIEYARTCFEEIQNILHRKSQGRILVQILVPALSERAVFAGLSALLKSAALENPLFVGQLIFVSKALEGHDLVELLSADRDRPQDTIIRYESGRREILTWVELADSNPDMTPLFKEGGVYLITGGMGGLGYLFAMEILRHTHTAKIILTGRSELTAEKKAQIECMGEQSENIVYMPLDVRDIDQVKHLMDTIKRDYDKLDGIIHSAGVVKDNFIQRKTSAEFDQVLSPKVIGTYNLDIASHLFELDFFVLFSSVAGVLGNIGQIDYATANAFMDHFAAYRNLQVAEGERIGKTLSINWPLWQEGGMKLSPEKEKLLAVSTGMQPMRTETGIRAFFHAMHLPDNQFMVMEGEPAKIRQTIFAPPLSLQAIKNTAKEDESQSANAIHVATIEKDTPVTEKNNIIEKSEKYLKRKFSQLLKIPVHKMDSSTPLEAYGMDSILAMKLTNALENTFGSLSKTLFFEYQSIAELAIYMASKFPQIIATEEADLDNYSVSPKDMKNGRHDIIFGVRNKKTTQRFFSLENKIEKIQVAIVGLAGKYPQASDLKEFWSNLKTGRDCVTEIPTERWDNNIYFHPAKNQPGKTYSKWGGFISDIDKFDPLFFNISPKEAELLDPQERLFLETAWHTLEDAGHSKESLSGKRIGVYVGVMWGHYELFGVESAAHGKGRVPSSSYASIANRVSYFFNFQGPSIALDSMCSSSLTAIHLACEAVRHGEVEGALAGGVNVSIHPNKYLSLSQGNFHSSDGRCRSFGEGGDGYVPGEGVGAVFLKPLSKAVNDGDHVYGIVKGSAINHGGKTNGYTVPNPNAQGSVIREALDKANISPFSLSYIETHGTGTSLGDPIEITGLIKVFEESASVYTRQSCAIGSVKSNIGHLESAAGIAALTKVLLQLKHNQLVPSLHAHSLNPNINFNETPFFVQRELSDWKRQDNKNRCFAVSSFGAGGSNAHIVLEEFEYASLPGISSSSPLNELFVISATNPQSLYTLVENISEFLNENPDSSLADLAYTSQVGRSAMSFRLAFSVPDIATLQVKITLWLDVVSTKKERLHEADISDLDGVLFGHVNQSNARTRDLVVGEAGKQFLEAIVAERELEKIAQLWVSGADVNWILLHKDRPKKRISFPYYPFLKERCWLNIEIKTADELNSSKEHTGNPVREEPKSVQCFRPQWNEKNLHPENNTCAIAGVTLILNASDKFIYTFKAELENTDVKTRVLTVKFGETFHKTDDCTYEVNPGKENDFLNLVIDLQKHGNFPQQLIYCCHTPASIVSRNTPINPTGAIFYSLLHLIKTLMTKRSASLIAETSLLKYSIKIAAVFYCERNFTSPEYAALGGFFKTLYLENPAYQGKTIEIVAEHVSKANITALDTQSVRCVLNELESNDWSSENVRYEVNEDSSRYFRYVQSFSYYHLDYNNEGSLPLKQCGVYLVTGGLGGIGYLFAEHLAKTFSARLVLVGRSKLDEKQYGKIRELQSFGAQVFYRQANVSSMADMTEVINFTKEKFSKINGIMHCAGINRDSFIIRKSQEEMEAVLSAKVIGTHFLDQASIHENLDFFLLFSSVAGALGNTGQSDYAYSNAFIDAFAHYREALRKEKKRFGKTFSINWPYWENGGMHITEDEVRMNERKTGVYPLPANKALQFWQVFLQSPLIQGMVLYGIPEKINNFVSYISQSSVNSSLVHEKIPMSLELPEKTEMYLKNLIGNEIQLDPERIDPRAGFDTFGIDSVAISKINTSLEADLGHLPKTLIYEYDSVTELTNYLVHQERQRLMHFFSISEFAEETDLAQSRATLDISGKEINRVATDSANDLAIRSIHDNSDAHIAVIGLHGIYPQSETLEAYWENLKEGRDLIKLVPKERWDYEPFFDADPKKSTDGKIYCKWGGFLNDIDQFDANLFNVSEQEARIIDPQERLFMQSVWSAVEDAGYTRAELRKQFPKGKSADVGVFVGVTTNSYHLLVSDEWRRGNMVTPGSMPWSIANRISYFFDFQGPSMPIDTACSSSLVAIHLACESLKSGECQLAIAGGVNLYLHQSKYHAFCQKRMLSVDGKCRSFGAGDDGFVPSEGIGTLVLKPLKRAIEDQDNIYSVILGSAFEHSGRSNGYSAPNPNSQAKLIHRTLSKSKVSPQTISYIEGHGTGTQLGDSLEITALSNAFRKEDKTTQYCSVGSVKSNMGHAESAAGIAGVTKVILQFQHQQLVPTIHVDEVNPNIRFEETPFYLQKVLAPWHTPAAIPRRAIINSFGAGGVNACVLMEEYISPIIPASTKNGPCLIVLSAKAKDRLTEYVKRFSEYINNNKAISLQRLSYTLQTGREPMEERLAFPVSDIEELLFKLAEWIACSKAGKATPGVYQASSKKSGTKKRHTKEQATFIAGLFESEDLFRLAELWVSGEDLDWVQLYPDGVPAKMSLPTYPFSKTRYWVSDSNTSSKRSPIDQQDRYFHPFISYNSSTLQSVSFTSALSPDKFYSIDHKVNGSCVFPGTGFVELACIAGNIAGERKVARIRDIVWANPLRFENEAIHLQTYLKTIGDCTEYEIVSFDTTNEKIVHSEGRIEFRGWGDTKDGKHNVSVISMKEQYTSSVNRDELYKKFEDYGFWYGPGFRSINEFYTDGRSAFSHLKLSEHLLANFDDFVLHPSLLDGALQTVIGLVDTSIQPAQAYVPFALDEVEIFLPLTPICYARAESALESQENALVRKFNIQLFNQNGDLAIKLNNFYVRAIRQELTVESEKMAGPDVITS